MTESEAPLRSAVIGCRMAHVRVLADLDDFELAAVCDLDEEAAREAAECGRDVGVYTDSARMLEQEKPEVVAVGTPNDSHAELTIQAAEAGARGICCEKPLAVNMGEGRAMLDACRRNGTRLICNHQRRMRAEMVKARELIEDGALGDVYLIRGTCAGDVLSDGTHTVDSIRWLAGDVDVKWVLGQIYREEPDPDEPKAGGYHRSGGYRYGHLVESGGMGTLEFETGLRAEMLFGDVRFPGRPYQDYEVLGTEGRLWRKGDRAEPALLIEDTRGGGWRGVELEDEAESRSAMRESYRAFARTIREGASHPLSGESALKDLEVVMAVYESARTNRRIDLPLRQEELPLRLMVEQRTA